MSCKHNLISFTVTVLSGNKIFIYLVFRFLQLEHFKINVRVMISILMKYLTKKEKKTSLSVAETLLLFQ